MNKTFALTIPLLFAPAVLAVAPSPPPPVDAATPEDFEKLQASYLEELEAWNKLIADAPSLKVRKELREKHPARTWWPKFERAGKTDGRALLWQVEYLEHRGLDAKKAGAAKTALLERLVDKHVTAAYFDDVMQVLRKEKSFSEEALEGIYREALEKNGHKAVQSAALYRIADLYEKSSDAEKQAQVDGLMARLVSEYAGTKYGTLAHSKVIKAEDLEDGKVSPDFYGETIDGHGFSLSDYRGKVVLVDFYGFW
jgi:hypothetical protein